MSNLSDKLKDQFLEELIAEGDLWRILRKNTVADLLRLEFIAYNIKYDSAHLQKIFNYVIKYLMMVDLPAIKRSPDIKKVLEEFNNHYSVLVESYEKIVDGLLEKYNGVSTERFDLSNQVQYLRIINQLDIDDYSEEIIEEIAWGAYSLLIQQTN